MSAAGWTVSDNTQAPPPSGAGWAVSDGIAPPAAPTSTQPSLTENKVNPGTGTGYGTYQMHDSSGKVNQIPYFNVGEATDQGYKFHDDQERWRYAHDNAADPNKKGTDQVAMHPVGGPQSFEDFQSQDANRVKNESLPMQALEGVAKAGATMGRPVLDAASLAMGTDPRIVDQMIAPQTKFQQGVRNATVTTAMLPAVVEAPFATLGATLGGIGGSKAGELAGKTLGMSPAATAVMSDVGGLAGGVGGGMGGAKLEPKVNNFFTDRQTPPGENFTPRQAKSHAAVIAEGSSGGDTGYIPRDISDATSSTLRRTAAQNPAIVKAIREGTPEDAYAAHQSILQKAKADIDQQHEAALAPVQDTPVDMSGVQKAIQPTKYELEGMDPADAKAVEELQARAGQIKTLRGLNEFRKTLNNEDAALLKNPMGTGKSALYPKSVHELANAAREAYYDALEKASGQDFTDLKRLEGNIIQEQRGAVGAGSRLSVNQAKDVAPHGPLAATADVIDSGGKLPVAGWAANKLRGTKLGQIQQHLQRFYSDLPNAPVPAPQTPSFYRPAPRALPNPQRQLPSDVPANAEVGPAGQTQAPAPQAVTPPRFNVSPEGVARPGAPAPPEPAVVTPSPTPTPQLPAEASPAGYGDWRTEQRARAGGVSIPPSGIVQPLPPKITAPQLTSGEGNPEFVTPPPSPPPNAAGAVDRLSPPLAPNPEPTPTSPAGFRVGPNGEAVRAPAGELPAPKAQPSPATHEWSKSAWREANPKRDLAKAVAHARKLGYRVVD